MISIGMALGSGGRMVATIGREIWRSSFALDELPAALEELQVQTRVRRARLTVALAPPWMSVRQIELPRLRARELREIVGRDIDRYFPIVSTPQVVAAIPVAARRASPTPYVTAAADAGLVASIFEAVEQVGWLPEAVVPAYDAWVAAARRIWPTLRRGQACLVLIHDDRTDVLVLHSGCWSLVRRFPGAEPSAAIVEAATMSRGAVNLPDADMKKSAVPVAILGSPERRAVFEAALMAHDIQPLLSPDATPLLDDLEALAARYAPAARRGLGVVPEARREDAARRQARLRGRLVAATAALLIATAGVELWGSHRELTAIRAHRAAIAGEVARAMQLRAAVEGVNARLGALARTESAAPRWSSAIAMIAEHLPADAHLVRLRGSGDSLMLEGMAARAATTFAALQQAPTVAAVHAEAPIRQEARDSQPPIERFTVGARLVSR